MDAFAALAVQRFEAKMVAHLRSLAGDTGDDDDGAELLRFVKEDIEEARGWGIGGEAEVRTLLEWRQALGPGFHLDESRAEIRAVLEDPFLAGFAKVQRVRRMLAAEGS
ncbi:MAG TPA: hypothetical protein VF746_00400 [Longimicrobium sp.]|jgi:hypothetical protein